MNTPRRRKHASARTAGTRFERQVADTLAAYVGDGIDRRVRTGAKHRGDITGLRHMGARVVVEVKNTSRITIGPWLEEVDRNDAMTMRRPTWSWRSVTAARRPPRLRRPPHAP